MNFQAVAEIPTSVRRWKAYPAYKDSGSKWLGLIPEDWQVKRIKFLASFHGGGTPSKENLDYWNGDIPWVSPKDMKSEAVNDSEEHITKEGLAGSATQLVQVGAVLVVVRSGILKHSIPVAVNTKAVALNQDMKAMVPRSGLSPDYLKYLIVGHQDALLVEWRKAGATVESIEHELLVNSYFPIPSLDEQCFIVDLLDRETAKIDALVAKKERLIELLQEKRTALITRAVTKGLDPNMPMKNSGVEWLGEVPAHWEIRRLKHVVVGGLVNGLFKKQDQFGSGVKLINVVDLYRDNFLVDFENLERVEAEPRELDAYSVLAGDIFFVRSSLKLEGVAASACLAKLEEPAVFECHLVRVRPSKKDVTPEYLVNYLNSSMTRQRLVSLAETTTMTTIAQPKLASIRVLVPPVPEQRRVIYHVDRETTKINALIAKIREGIEKLKEYRTALISAAVTGKIDVREEISD